MWASSVIMIEWYLKNKIHQRHCLIVDGHIHQLVKGLKEGVMF